MEGCTETVSKRCQEVLSIPSVLVKYGQKVHNNQYHEVKNPNGIIDFGTAENKVCEEMLFEKLNSLKLEKEDPEQLYYPNLKGLTRDKLKLFLKEMLSPVNDIDTEEIVVMSGTTALLEVLAYALAERGDYFLVPSPYYYRIKNDFGERAGILCYDVPLYSKGFNGTAFHLTVSKLENAFHKATSEDKKVKGLLLINPQNPLGVVYSKNDLLGFLQFASQYKLHVIVDEIYALSVFDKNTTFHSVLSLPLPDPQRTHFIWGFSKDLGLSGFRCGILHTKNKHLIEYATQVAIYHLTPPLIQKKLEKLITDIDWIKKVYLPTYHSKLMDQFTQMKERLEKLGVHVHPSKAGFFIWANMEKYLPEKSVKGEEYLQERFLEGNVYILGGTVSYCAEPGWFRIVFSSKKHLFDEGLRRIEKVLMSQTSRSRQI